MKTTTLQPGTDWVQACDGTKNMLLQLVSGSAVFCVSDVIPAQDAAFHFMPAEVLITVSPPTKVWVKSGRTYKNDTQLVISETE
ncbi:hypothetical protein V8I69_003928 [Salmonella enterica]